MDTEVLDSTNADTPPVRSCYGCGQSDDHPRFTHVPDLGDAAKDEHYHYDCIPHGVRQQHGVDDKHPVVKAAKAGKRGAALRKIAVEHARSIIEDPADDGQEG